MYILRIEIRCKTSRIRIDHIESYGIMLLGFISCSLIISQDKRLEIIFNEAKNA